MRVQSRPASRSARLAGDQRAHGGEVEPGGVDARDAVAPQDGGGVRVGGAPDGRVVGVDRAARGEFSRALSAQPFERRLAGREAARELPERVGGARAGQQAVALTGDGQRATGAGVARVSVG